MGKVWAFMAASWLLFGCGTNPQSGHDLGRTMDLAVSGTCSVDWGKDACGQCLDQKCCAPSQACAANSTCSPCINSQTPPASCASDPIMQQFFTCAQNSPCAKICFSTGCVYDFGADPCGVCISSSCCSQVDRCANSSSCDPCLGSNPPSSCRYNADFQDIVSCVRASCSPQCYPADMSMTGPVDMAGPGMDLSNVKPPDLAHCGALYGYCDANSLCCTGMDCYRSAGSSLGQCYTSIHGACTVDKQCSTYASCIHGSCELRSQEGGPCDTLGDCDSGTTCSNGTCVAVCNPSACTGCDYSTGYPCCYGCSNGHCNLNCTF